MEGSCQDRPTKFAKIEQQSDWKDLLREGNFKEAFSSLEKKAQEGHVCEMVYLGLNYERGGLSLKKNAKFAKNWFKKAAAKKDAYALYIFGDRYANYSKRDVWFNKAWHVGDHFGKSPGLFD